MNLKKLLSVFLVLYSLCLPCVAAEQLYPGEKLAEVNGVQALFKFIKGDEKQPLIIFVPGAAHLARISYGFPAGKEEDFLSYWLHKKGYSFLGVSYPIDNPVYTKIYPSFSIRDWGNQIAVLAQKTIEQNHLPKHVVVLGWSMAGNVEESVTEALEKKQINVDAFIGLSAVTPISYLGQEINGFKGNKLLSNQLLDERLFFNLFAQLIAEQSKYNGHEIIPRKVYLNEFLGNIPVALEGQGYHMAEDKPEFSFEYAINDSGIFHFNHTPWIGLINDDSSTLPKIAFVDTAAWNYISREMLYAQYFSQPKLNSPSNYAENKQLLQYLPQNFSATVHGNHFFFVGKFGAQETADTIELIIKQIDVVKQKLESQKSVVIVP